MKYHKLSEISSLLSSFMSFCCNFDNFLGTFILNFKILCLKNTYMVSDSSRIGAFYTIIKKPHFMSRLSTWRNGHSLDALNSFNLDLPSKNSCYILKLNLAMNVVTFNKLRITIDSHFFSLLNDDSHIKVTICMFISLMTVVFHSENAFVVSTLFYVNLFFHIFVQYSGTLTLFAVKFIPKTWTACTLHFLLVFPVKDFTFASTGDTCLGLFISTWGTVDFTCELDFLLTTLERFC